MAGEIAGTEKLLRENPQITILRSEDALYCIRSARHVGSLGSDTSRVTSGQNPDVMDVLVCEYKV